MVVEIAPDCTVEWSTQDCANFAWPFGKIGLRGDELMEMSHASNFDCIHGFSTQSVANLSRAHIMVNIWGKFAMGGTTTNGLSFFKDFSPHDLAYLEQMHTQAGMHNDAVAGSSVLEVL